MSFPEFSPSGTCSGDMKTFSEHTFPLKSFAEMVFFEGMINSESLRISENVYPQVFFEMSTVMLSVSVGISISSLAFGTERVTVLFFDTRTRNSSIA